MASAKKLSPMMQQYLLIKEQYPDCLLFFRLGDFYELFFEDAETASKELEIVLTGRNCGLEERAPMCGVPFHSVDSYVKRLIDKGYKVAICEQLTEPGKGLVERDIVRIITPGTVIEENMVQPDCNNYIVAIYAGKGASGYAYCDVSSGEFYAGSEKNAAEALAAGEILAPREVVVNAAAKELLSDKKCEDILITLLEEEKFKPAKAAKVLQKHFGVSTLSGFGFSDTEPAICAAGALLQYLLDTQKVSLMHITRLLQASDSKHMVLDANTRRNLELTQSMMGGSKKGSLLWALDHTKSAAGARLLRRWIEHPLLDAAQIIARQDAVEELSQNHVMRQEIEEQLSRFHDVERLCSKVAYNTINPRDVKAIGESMELLPYVIHSLRGCKSTLLQKIQSELDPLEEIAQVIKSAIADNPPISAKEGWIIRKGYNKYVDEYRSASSNGRHWLAELEAKEREETGIKNLKIGYNKVFGYYIEVTKSQMDLVPYRYMRKQTLTNAERYITEELKEMEDTILGADEKAMRLEYQIFVEIRDKITEVLTALQNNARNMAELDVLCSLASTAYEYNYTRPKLNDEGIIAFQESRHPVVERSVANFVPNDCYLNSSSDRFLILTGPNMAGKSTFMRQIALLVLLTHIGSFVPAKSGNVCLVDRIFTRVGASDDLASGRSTFMVEMVETANILHNATKNSLVLLDEIGRGTSTFDGLSIAWAVTERITQMGCKAVFATHYHELSEMERLTEGVKNYCIMAREVGEDIVFLHRIVRGGTDKSFGIQVARLAGLPKSVITRAKQVLKELNKLDVDGHIVGERQEKMFVDAPSGDENIAGVKEQIFRRIAHLEMDTLTPIQALNLLNELHMMTEEDKS